MDIDVDPDELEAYTKRWELKWHYFQEAFPETDQNDVDGMGRDEIRARGTLLVSQSRFETEIVTGHPHQGTRVFPDCRADTRPARTYSESHSWWNRMDTPTVDASSKTDYEIIAGSIFTINLMQECQPELVRLLVSVLI
jgi:hypothetical protein